MITKKTIADKLLAYLKHQISLTELADWAEKSLIDSSYEDDDSHTIRNVLAQLGLADVKSFGLEWRDCEEMMEKLGFKLEVNALEIA
ncbi:MAG: hypothetical protein ACTHOB_15615 [Ginsengibacter sp.]